MALPASDAFTNSNGTALATHNGNFTVLSGGFQIQSNALSSSTTSTGVAYWNADAFDDDQYVQAVIAAIASSSGRIGIGCRINTDPDGYTMHQRNFGAESCAISRVDAGSITTIDSDGSADGSVSDLMLLEAQGSDITGTYNASPRLSASDATHASGVGGVFADNISGTSKMLDDWEAGNINVPPVLSQANFRFYLDDGGLP